MGVTSRTLANNPFLASSTAIWKRVRRMLGSRSSVYVGTGAVAGAAVPGVEVPRAAVSGVAVPLPGVEVPGIVVPGVAVPELRVSGVVAPGVGVSGIAMPGVSVSSGVISKVMKIEVAS
jgi:hypothetical protein